MKCNHNDNIPKDSERSKLSETELKVRKFLISVSKGRKRNTRHSKRATYKEVWNRIYPEREFGQGNTKEIVNWIVKISNYDTENGRLPLNSLVVRQDTGEPGDGWEDWQNNSSTKYRTLEAAQDACWEQKHWQ